MRLLKILLCLSTVLLYGHCVDVDTVGTDFVTILPWNNGKVGSQPKVSMDFMNANQNADATVTITYNAVTVNGWDVISTPETNTVTVPRRSSKSFIFPIGTVYQYLAPGLNNYPSTKISIHSSIPISVFAHNYDENGAGDVFTVLPTSMASTEYAFSLPAPAMGTRGFAMLYFLPTVTDSTIQFSITTDPLKTTNYAATASAAQSAKVVMFGGPLKDFTFYASGTQPFVVVAAIRFMETFEASPKKDFGCFMPMPLSTKTCQETEVNDFHYSDLSSVNYFTLTPPGLSCSRVRVYGFGTNDKDVDPPDLPQDVVQKPRGYPSRQFGEVVGFQAENIRLQIVRYGGYKIGTITNGTGAYLDNMPSVAQFVTGTTAYLLKQNTSQVVVFGDAVTTNSATDNGGAIARAAFKELNYYGTVIYYATLTNTPVGKHFFSAEGKYILYVTNTKNNYALGYTPRFIWHGYPEPPPSPPPTMVPTRVPVSTTLLATIPTTVSVSTPPPTTVPTVASVSITPLTTVPTSVSVSITPPTTVPTVASVSITPSTTVSTSVPASITPSITVPTVASVSMTPSITVPTSVSASITPSMTVPTVAPVSTTPITGLPTVTIAQSTTAKPSVTTPTKSTGTTTGPTIPTKGPPATVPPTAVTETPTPPTTTPKTVDTRKNGKEDAAAMISKTLLLTLLSFLVFIRQNL